MEDVEFARRSLDLSSLDDIPEERAYSKGDESNRLDSGLGEWDSSSSRKTSVSSQGSRLSPEINEKTHVHNNRESREVSKRRRSGIDMITNKKPSVLMGSIGPHPQIVMTRLPRIPRSNRSSGRWSRKISPAGIEFLKMDDEMEEVMRNGKLVLVPRKISDHIPTVPIHSTDRFLVHEWNENLGLEDEDLQIYKKPKTDKYQLHRHKWEFFGKRDFRKMMILALDGDQWMSGQQKYELMKTLLSEKDQRKMEKMLKMGYSHEDVVNHFMDEADQKSGTNSLRKKMEQAMKEAQNEMSDEEMIELMKSEMGEESIKEMEKMIKEGKSVKDVMNQMMVQGNTKEEELLEKAETLNHLMKSKKKNIKLTEKEAEKLIDERFDQESKDKVKDIMKSGLSVKNAIKTVINETKPKENLTDIEKKVKMMTEGKDLSQYQMYELIKEQLDEESRKKMEEMVKNGCPLDEAIEYFLKKGKTAEQVQNEKSEKLRQMMGNAENMDQDDAIEMIMNELGKEDRAQMEKMLASGCSKQEVIDHFLNRGKEDAGTELKTEFQEKMEELLAGKCLNDDEVLALMRGQLDEKGKEEIKEMLAKGYSKKDIINHLLKNTKTVEEKERENIEKLSAVFNDQNMSDEEKLSMLEKQLSNEDKIQMEEMLKNGCSIEEVIGHFMSRSMSPEREKSAFAKDIERLAAGKDMTEGELLQLISENLDQESVEKMNEMLKKGYSKQDVINHFMKNAKTKEEQMKETADKIKALMNDDSMTDKDKLEILRNQLSKEDVAQMEILLKDGGSVEDVMSQILKSKSTESLSETELSKAVNQLIDGRDLSKEEILDIIKGQIDEDAKLEMAAMMKKGLSQQEVIDHYLSNGKTIKEKRREISGKIKALISDIQSSPLEKIELIKSVLLPADIRQMEKMLASGLSMEEVIAHFADRSMQEETTTELSKRIKKLSNDKPLAPEQLLELIKGQLGESGISEMNDMMQKGYNAQDIVEHFLSKGKTKDEENTVIGNKLKNLLDLSKMSQDEIMTIMNEQLSEQEKAIVNEMLKEGKSLENILNELSGSPPSSPKSAQTESLSERIKKLSGNRKLSTEEMLKLIEDNIADDQKKEMAKMLADGISPEEVAKHFMEHGKCKTDDHKQLSQRIEALIDVDTMEDDEIKRILESQLSIEDRNEMEFMLKNGCSMEEVVAYFKCRGMEPEENTSELSKKVKKLSQGKNISEEDMLLLIRDQLGQEGKADLDAMVKKGMSTQDIIEFFMANGKTEHEEHKEVAQRIGKLVQKRKLSKEEIKDILDSQLGSADKAKMSEMLTHGCSLEEVLQHFLVRGCSPEKAKTELAKRVRKMSKGKGFTKKEIIDIIRLQLTQERQEELDQMLSKGYYQDDVITHFMCKGKTCDEEHREIADKLSKIIDPEKMTEEQIIDLIKENVGNFDKAQVEEMLRCGCTTPEILNLFLNRGKLVSYKTELFSKVQKLVEGKVMHPLDLLEVIKEHACEDLVTEISKLLEKGYSVQDVIEHALKFGKTQEEIQKEVATKMLHLLESNMSEEEVIKIMKKQLGKAGNAKLEEMLKQGYSLGDVLDAFMEKTGGSEQEEDTEFAKKIKQLMGDRSLDADEMILLIKSQLEVTTQMQLDEMLRNGCSKDEVIQHFMNREKYKKGQKKNEFGRKIFELTKGTKLTRREIILLMKNHLDEDSCTKMEDMIKKCYPLEDIIDYFLKYGKTPEQALKEKTLQKEFIRKEASRKIRKMVDGNNLSNEEILAILKLQMGDEDKAQLEMMLKKGCSASEIIEHFMQRDVSDDENEQTLFEKKISELMQGKDLTKDEILELMKSELDDESVRQIDNMLSKGYTKEDVIKYFMKHGDERNEFVQEMKKLTDNKDMSKEELLELMKNKVGVLSQRKIDDMLREGYSLDEIIQHVMTHGKTQEQETHLFTRRMSLILDEKPLTEKEKVEKLKENLGKEAASMVEELLKNGLTPDNILGLFLKYGDNLNSLVKDEFFIKELIFPDELPDAYKLRNRDVFQVIDRDEAKKLLPWMSPSGKVHIFGLFFEKVLMLIEGKELTHREILNLMRSRMGAGYAKEFDELREKGFTLQQIIDYFLKRDGETIAESRLVAKLKADARVDSRVYLKRNYSKEKWGVSLTYTFSKDHGLHLILNDVIENGPAWESGVRPGDVIVTVNDWLIVLMDRPQVAAHLFQAGANIVKLGIQKSRGTSPDRYLGMY